MIAGSNPNLDVETRLYPTEYRTEMLFPVRHTPLSYMIVFDSWLRII
jgi:hypothetical protein